MIKNLIFYSVLIAASGILLKCTRPEEGADKTRVAASAATCTLPGTWTRCISNGTASGLITFIVNDDYISQKTDTFLSNPSCAGLPDGESIAEITYKMGPAGQSTFLRGGTDMDLTSSTDLGCGSDATVYSVIKFNDDCSQFYPVQMMPGCTPSERGLILDTVPFVRQ